MKYQTAIYKKKGPIAYITLNRPEALNAFNNQMMWDMQQIWHDFEDDEKLWIAILTGDGDRAFCTGADVKEVAGEGPNERIRNAAVARRDPWGRHKNLRITSWQNGVTKPVITAVNGMCVGGGLHFIADTDICICSENATFFDTHVNVGLVSALEPIGLLRRIPTEAVFRMVFMGSKERMSARRAYELGLVSEVVPLPRLIPRATEIAEVICENSPIAVRISKEAIWKGLDAGYTQAYELGEYIWREVEDTYERIEGPRAFKEKRKPQWKGVYEAVT